MNTEASRPSAGRVAYLDALRILCSFLVIVNHTYNYIGLERVSGSVRFAALFSLFSSKVAVPIFLMISGCTLLGKTDSLPRTLQRFFRIAVTLVVFSFIYEIYGCVFGNTQTLSIKRFLNTIYTQPISIAYWYLYAYAGIMLMLPFLQRLAKGMSRSDYLFFFAVSFFFVGLWPMIVEYTPVSEYCHRFELPLFSAHICYMLLGYFLYTHRRKAYPVLPLLLFSLLIITACTAAADHAFSASGGTRYLFLDNISLLPIMLTSVCTFLLAARLPLRGRIAEAARILGGCTFGIYLLGDLMIAVLIPLFYALRESVHPLIAVTGYQIACWLAALACTVVLKRIPLIRKLL